MFIGCKIYLDTAQNTLSDLINLTLIVPNQEATILIYFNSNLMIFFALISRENGGEEEGGERETTGERHIDWLPPAKCSAQAWKHGTD